MRQDSWSARWTAGVRQDSRREAGQAGRMQDSRHKAGQPQKAQAVRAGQEMSKNVDSFSLK